MTWQSIFTNSVRVAHEAGILDGTILRIFFSPPGTVLMAFILNKLVEDPDDLILLSGFFENSNELRLIRRNGELVARWPVQFSEIFESPSHIPIPPATDWNVDIYGALAPP